MMNSPRIRKLTLLTHVISSVGWIGAATGVLALSIVGMTDRDVQMVRAAYLAMESLGRLVLVPLAFASLLTGILQGLVTTWGLIRHYWVLVKLVLNVAACGVLLLIMQEFGKLADVAKKPTWSSADLSLLQSSIALVHAAAALLLLLVATVLSIYKPRGMTGYGRRKQRENQTRRPGVRVSSVPANPD